MSFGKQLTLSTGAKIPQIGLGTWLSTDDEAEKAVEFAIKNGYRHLDLAFVYENQKGVGAALKKVIPLVVNREDLFITSKLWNSSHHPANVEKELDETLRQLGIDYLDLYLMHWPVAFPPGKGLMPRDPQDVKKVVFDTTTSVVETWKAMIALPKSKVKAIGVSNFTIEHIEGIIAATGVKPAVNQVEAHPLLPQDELMEYCRSENIVITAYSPLGHSVVGKPLLTEYEPVKKVAENISNETTPAQVLIAWGVHRGFVVIPKSANEKRIKSNFEQVKLSQEDYEKINAIGAGKHERRNIPIFYDPSWDVNIFDDEVEKNTKYKVKIQ